MPPPPPPPPPLSSATFDPNAPAQPGAGIFGLPNTEEDALVVLVPVPWEATTSYGGGAAAGPQAILEASKQVDLYDLDVDGAYQPGIFMLPTPAAVAAKNDEAKALARPIIEAGGAHPAHREALTRVNALSGEVNAWVERETTRLLANGKIVGIIGGDHSVPYGAIRAMAHARESRGEGGFGIVHVDAHSDTRQAYEGFEHSHASIMHNVLSSIPLVTRVVQVGIRDVCEAEMTYVRSLGARVRVVTDRESARRRHSGEPFGALAEEIAASLPADVWISFDIDGLDPRLCPHTGTPVPGGLDFSEAIALLRAVTSAGKRIIGFDLDEVAPGEDDDWDGNVAARLLYKMVAFTLASQGRATLRP